MVASAIAPETQRMMRAAKAACEAGLDDRTPINHPSVIAAGNTSPSRDTEGDRPQKRQKTATFETDHELENEDGELPDQKVGNPFVGLDNSLPAQNIFEKYLQLCDPLAGTRDERFTKKIAAALNDLGFPLATITV